MTSLRSVPLLLATLLSLAACSSSGPPQPKLPPNPKAAPPPQQPHSPEKPRLPPAPKPPPRVVENSLGMKFVQVPGGEFVMGSTETPAALAYSYPQYDARRLADLADEAPPHRIRITRSFFLASMRSPSDNSAAS